MAPRRRQLLDNPFAQGLPVNVFGRGIHQQPCPLGHSLSFQQLCREPEILQPSIDTGPQEDLMDLDPRASLTSTPLPTSPGSATWGPISEALTVSSFS